VPERDRRESAAEQGFATGIREGSENDAHLERFLGFEDLRITEHDCRDAIGRELGCNRARLIIKAAQNRAIAGRDRLAPDLGSTREEARDFRGDDAWQLLADAAATETAFAFPKPKMQGRAWFFTEAKRLCIGTPG
jgi:hypothetical protein